MLIKVVGIQAEMGRRLTLEEKIHIFKQRPDFACLPEYYVIDETITDYQRAALRQAEYVHYLERLSDELSTCLIAGTIVEAHEGKLYNTCYVIDHGAILGSYRKRFPVPGELARGITAGSEPLILDIDGVRIGLMICGDVFYPHLYAEMHRRHVDVTFVPTTSLYRPDDSLSQKKQRDQIYFIDGAASACAYVVKVCGVGRIFGRPLQGRTLVAAPWGMLKQVSMHEEQQRHVLTATLDLAELREFRVKTDLLAGSYTPVNPGLQSE